MLLFAKTEHSGNEQMIMKAKCITILSQSGLNDLKMFGISIIGNILGKNITLGGSASSAD